MKKESFELLSSVPIAREVYELVLRGDCSAITAPGQFVNIEVEGFYLRRPISVCDVNGDRLTLVCKTVGKGTRALCSAPRHSRFDLLTGLGNGYDLSQHGLHPVLAGGGVGTPPLYLLAKRLLAMGLVPDVALGFADAASAFYLREFEAIGCRVAVATADGSLGCRGLVTDVIQSAFPQADYVFCCGPEAMLRAVYDLGLGGGQYSFEERMGCGFGACMGCSCRTKYGAKRICKDGPVLKAEEILW